jgi:hypothetical protein
VVIIQGAKVYFPFLFILSLWGNKAGAGFAPNKSKQPSSHTAPNVYNSKQSLQTNIPK